MLLTVERHQHKTLTVFPFASCRVDDAKQFVVGDRLRVKVNSHRFLLQDLVGLEQGLPDHALASPGVTDYEHGVSDVEQFLKLYHLQQATIISSLLLTNNAGIVGESLQCQSSFSVELPDIQLSICRTS